MAQTEELDEALAACYQDYLAIAQEAIANFLSLEEPPGSPLKLPGLSPDQVLRIMRHLNYQPEEVDNLTNGWEYDYISYLEVHGLEHEFVITGTGWYGGTMLLFRKDFEG